MNYLITKDGMKPFDVKPKRLFDFLTQTKSNCTKKELSIMQEMIDNPNIVFASQTEKDIIKKQIGSLITGRLMLSQFISKIPQRVAKGQCYVVYRFSRIGVYEKHDYFVYVMTMENSLLQKMHRESVIDELIKANI